MLNADGTVLLYAAAWKRLAVTRGTVNAGSAIAAELFADAAGLPSTMNGIAGATTIDANLAQRLRDNPKAFSTMLTSTDSPVGVRGQLAKTASPQPHAVNAAVLSGMQIYHCTASAEGTRFTQFGVAAVLDGSILHSFAKPAAGPPQWIAPDGSAVTGTLVAPTPNPGNIPELVLDATRIGNKTGVLGSTVQILRLNTTGGLAPTGTCQLGAITTSPYTADYLFLS